MKKNTKKQLSIICVLIGSLNLYSFGMQNPNTGQDLKKRKIFDKYTDKYDKQKKKQINNMYYTFENPIQKKPKNCFKQCIKKPFFLFLSFMSNPFETFFDKNK